MINSAQYLGATVVLLSGFILAKPALAADYLCSDIVTTRKIPGTSQAGPLPTAKTMTLLLHVDEDVPARSSLEWHGDANMEGIKSRLPDDVKLIKANGTLAATASAVKDGLGSVVTLTLDSKGGLRIAESSLVPQGVVYDITEGMCKISG